MGLCDALSQVFEAVQHSNRPTRAPRDRHFSWTLPQTWTRLLGSSTPQPLNPSQRKPDRFRRPHRIVTIARSRATRSPVKVDE